LNKQQQATIYRNESVVLSALDPTSVNNDCFYVGVEELDHTERFSFYSTGNNIFQSSIPVNALTVEVFGLDGKLVFSQSNVQSFELNAAPGIYCVVFQSEKHTGVQKVIVR
jgi:hypothetical protein